MERSALLGILGSTVLSLASSIYSAEGALSKEGIDFIKKHEGYSAVVYNDSAQKPTIGYGHLIKKGESYAKIDEEKAEELLRKDVSSAENTVKKYVTRSLTKNQYDALVSFVYNVGSDNFRGSTLLKKYNAGKSVDQEFERWVYAGGKKVQGLVNRRADEKKLFERK